MIVNRTFDIVDHCCKKYPDKKILYTKRFGKWESLITYQLKSLTDQLSIALQTYGIKKKLGKTEQIGKHLLVSDVWSLESGEISITQKLRRNILLQKYAHQIHELYIEDSWER